MKVTRIEARPDNITLEFKTKYGRAMHILPIFSYHIDEACGELTVTSVVSSKNTAIDIEKYLVDDKLVNETARIELFYLSERNIFDEKIKEVYITSIDKYFSATMFEFCFDIRNKREQYVKFS